jgi:zinc transport system substrate-binding protein
VEENRKLTRTLVNAAIVIALFWWSGCSGPGTEPSHGTISVAVSVFPIYDIARNICGDSAEAFFVIPAGADPHTYEPLPSIARRLQSVSLFIGVSRGFDGWMEHYLEKNTVRAYLIDEIAPGRGNANPHIWLSVRESRKIAKAIARNLCRVDPAHSNLYNENLAAYDRKLDDLDRSIAVMFRNTKNRSFIQWHEAWNYFAADYDLTIAGTVEREGSDKASVRSIKEIVDRAKRDHVRAVVVSLNAEDRTARVLAGEIGGEIVRLDGIGDPGSADRPDYIHLMQYNAKTLVMGLR